MRFCWRYTSFNASRRLLCSGERDVGGVYFADSVPLPYLFGKQAQQSAPQFGGGRSAAVLAMLGIGESSAVNVTILVARQPFLQYLAGLLPAEIEATRSIPTQLCICREPQMALIPGGVSQTQILVFQ